MAINVEPALSPHLVVDDAASAIDFYVKAFDAVELGRVPGPDGKLIHAALRINGFTVMLNDDVPQMCGGKSMTPTSLGGTPVTIHLTVTDVDAKFQRVRQLRRYVQTAHHRRFARTDRVRHHVRGPSNHRRRRVYRGRHSGAGGCPAGGAGSVGGSATQHRELGAAQTPRQPSGSGLKKSLRNGLPTAHTTTRR